MTRMCQFIFHSYITFKVTLANILLLGEKTVIPYATNKTTRQRNKILFRVVFVIMKFVFISTDISAYDRLVPHVGGFVAEKVDYGCGNVRKSELALVSLDGVITSAGLVVDIARNGIEGMAGL